MRRRALAERRDNRLWWFSLLFALPLLAGCGIPIASGTYFSPGFEPATPTTYAWRDALDHVQGDSRLEGNEYFHERLHESVGWELSLRGFRYSEENPQLLIHHHLSLADQDIETEVLDEAGVPQTERYSFESGGLVVHIVDARTGDDVWVGWAEASVEPAFRSPDAMSDWVYDLVGKMFEAWPKPARQ